ncbi:MAG TPA: class I SAM-dependent methyltransferase [Vicinamibacterales bacterium]|nr:class I SAM-dependent methyltransferase [Vicinamibacterales bacterium]
MVRHGVGLVFFIALYVIQGQQPEPRRPDVPYVPTPQPVVDAMLKLAGVTAQDVVYDLGCGDGRIPITAAQKYGARGVGIDIDPKRIEEANENAKAAGVTGKVRFLNQDLFTSDLSEATVVTLYLLPSLNEKLMPRLKKELKPGTRIVSHAFDMGSTWPPEKREEVDGKSIYLWTIQVSAFLQYSMHFGTSTSGSPWYSNSMFPGKS